MKRTPLAHLIIGLLAVVVVAALALNAPDETIMARYANQALIYAAMTIAALYFSVLFRHGEFSPAHAIGMVAFLSLPEEAYAAMLWAMFLGGAVGGTMLVLRQDSAVFRQRWSSRNALSIVAVTARVTLSFMVAARIYWLAGGELPLAFPVFPSTVALAAYGLGYCAVYLAIFVLETYAAGQRMDWIFKRGITVIGGVLLTPVPFAMLAAAILQISPTSILILALAGIAGPVALHSLSRARFQLHVKRDDFAALTAVSQLVQTDLKLSALIYAVYQQVTRLLPTDQFMVALYRSDGHQLHIPLALRRGRPVTNPDGRGEGTLLGHVLTRQAPLLIGRDAAAKARALSLEAPDPKVTSWLGVPLLARGRLLGAMIVASERADQRFSMEDQRLLSIVAASAGVAIDNAQLYEAQAKRAAQLTKLNQVLSLLTGSLSQEEVLDSILPSANAVSEATASAVYLLGPEDGALQLVRASGLSEAFAQNDFRPLTHDPRFGQTVVVRDVAHDERAGPYQTLLMRERKAAWIEMPLAVGETPLGLILLFYDQPQDFEDNDVEILRTFAGQAAQAIFNARTYTITDQALERRVEQMYTLATLGRQLTATMSVRAICGLVLGRALELSQASAGYILLIDDMTQEPAVIAQAGYPGGVQITVEAARRTISGKVLSSGQLIRADNLDEQRQNMALLEGGRSALSVPIQRSGLTLGTITLESDQAGMFSDEDSHYATQLANQAIISIDNRRLFERIAEARDRLEVILNAMTEGIVLIGRSGTITLANPRVSLIGLTPAQILNQDVDDLLEMSGDGLGKRMGFDSDDALRALVGTLRQGKREAAGEPVSFTVVGEHGTTHLQRQIIPLRGPDKELIGILLVFYDETEEHELAQMREDLSSMIVHDLRSPLTAVITGLRLLEDVVQEDNPAFDIVATTTETSQRAIRKILNRVNALLDISRMESGQLKLDIERCNLTTMVNNVLTELEPLAKDLNVKLVAEIAPEVATLEMDGDKMERVLQNLVDNALKFCPGGSQVLLRAALCVSEDGERRMPRIDVVDRGPGIPDDYKETLFNRFVQVKGRRGARRGSGIGLTFCKLVVEAHGGRIWVEDHPEGGSIFSLTLPKAEA